MQEILNKAYALRRRLHDNPEASLSEQKTLTILRQFIQSETSLEIIDLDSWFYVKVPGRTENPKLAFRADIDAVVNEAGCPRHLCGHDGHAATLAALALYLSKHKPLRPVYLIFQPAEEIGCGARMCRSILPNEGISRIFAYHNIPGYPCGSVLLRHGTFACASTGLEITLKGQLSHAAYPESGKNPSEIIAELILLMGDLVKRPHNGMVLGTVIGVSIGSDKYGVSAGDGVLRLTLRGEYSNEFEDLVSEIKSSAIQMARDQGFTVSIKEIERFEATENDALCTDLIRDAAEEAAIKTFELNDPFRWSEDFGEYLHKIPGTMFGVGDGEDYAQLHTESFEYPDKILEVPLKIFIQLANQ